MSKKETEEEIRERFRKKEHRKQHIAIALFIIVPFAVGIISAATGAWWLVPIMIFGGIGFALWAYDKKAFALVVGLFFFYLLIAAVL